MAPKRFNKKRNTKRSNRWTPARRELKKGYRPSIARTLQLATYARTSQVLKFTKQMSLIMDPQLNETYYLTFRANCMNDILLDYSGNNAPGTWTPTDIAFASTANIQPEGFSGIWGSRYMRHTVLSARCTVVSKGLDGGINIDPTNVYIIASQSATYVQNSTTQYQIEQRPYVVKNYQNSNTGMVGQSRLFNQLSVKKFLGVTDLKDVEEASALNEGVLPNTKPAKDLYFHVVFTNALGIQHAHPIARQHVTIKMEYITQLHGITASNVPQAGNAQGGMRDPADL